MKKIFFLFFMISFAFPLFSNEAGVKASLKEQYMKEKISFTVKEEFDVMYPININKFEFFKGQEKISFDDFVKISNDTLLLRNMEKVKKVKIAGFSTAAVFGTLSVLFLIPAVVFTVQMTNHNQIDEGYILSGIVCYALTGVSLVGLFIDLIVTFSLLHKFQYSAHAVRTAVDNYNENLMKKIGIIPDMSFNGKDLDFTLAYRF